MNRARIIFDSCQDILKFFYPQTRNFEILSDIISLLQPTISLLSKLNLSYICTRDFIVLVKAMQQGTYYFLVHIFIKYYTLGVQTSWYLTNK